MGVCWRSARECGAGEFCQCVFGSAFAEGNGTANSCPGVSISPEMTVSGQ